MKLRTKLAAIALLASGVAGTAVFAADCPPMQGFMVQLDRMTDANGMVSKADFLPMMERRWNAVDKTQRGMISRADLMRIFRDDTGQ
jgi:hypothetical protein